MGPSLQSVGFLLIISVSLTQGSFKNVINQLIEKATDTPLIDGNNQEKRASPKLSAKLTTPLPRDFLRMGNQPEENDYDESADRDEDYEDREDRPRPRRPLSNYREDESQERQDRPYRNRHQQRQNRNRKNDRQRNSRYRSLASSLKQKPNSYHHKPMQSVYSSHENIFFDPSHKFLSRVHHDHTYDSGHHHNLNQPSRNHENKRHQRFSQNRGPSRQEYRSQGNSHRNSNSQSRHRNRDQRPRSQNRYKYQDRKDDNYQYQALLKLISNQVKPNRNVRDQDRDEDRQEDDRDYSDRDDSEQDRSDLDERDRQRSRPHRNQYKQYQSRQNTHGKRERYGRDRYKSIGRQNEQQQVALRSPIVKSLLRISNDVNCGAQDECKNECEEEHTKKDDCDDKDTHKDQCEDTCAKKFDCEEEKKTDDCDLGDDCGDSNQDDNPSTRGVLLEAEANTECKRC